MKTSALSTALGLFPSVIKSGEHWSSSGEGSCVAVLLAAQAELTTLRSPAKPGEFEFPDGLLVAAISHAVNAEGLDARLETADFTLADLLAPRIAAYLRGQTDVQVYEAMTPQERAEAFSPERLGA